MLTALCDKLAIDPCMRLKDIVAFLHGEFEVDVNRFSIRRALKDISWSKKATQMRQFIIGLVWEPLCIRHKWECFPGRWPLALLRQQCATGVLLPTLHFVSVLRLLSLRAAAIAHARQPQPNILVPGVGNGCRTKG